MKIIGAIKNIKRDRYQCDCACPDGGVVEVNTNINRKSDPDKQKTKTTVIKPQI